MKFFLLMFSFFALHGCEYSEEDDENNEQTQEILLVEAIPVPTGNISHYLDLTGTLESVSQANVIPQNSGTVVALYVREGDQVEINTPLAKLHNPAVNAAAERATIELNRAKREFKKSEQLHRQGAISKREYQESTTALKTAKSSYQEAQKSKSGTLLRSPINGVVSAVDIRLGELSTGRAFQIVDPNQLRLVVSVPEKDLHQLKIDQAVLISGAYTQSATTSGRVERIGPVVDSQTGSVKVFIDVTQATEQLRPGQFVRANIKVDEHKNIILLPKSAIVYQDGKPLVFVVAEQPADPKNHPKQLQETEQKPHKFAIQKSVKLGYSTATQVEVEEGINVGDLAITSGNSHLRADAPVRLTEPKKNPLSTEDKIPTQQESK